MVFIVHFDNALFLNTLLTDIFKDKIHTLKNEKSEINPFLSQQLNFVKSEHCVNKLFDEFKMFMRHTSR